VCPLSSTSSLYQLLILLTDDPLTGMKENRVYSNLAKDQRDIAATNARYRISRQTIFCSATIPQR
jgi:hypothetical protein